MKAKNKGAFGILLIIISLLTLIPVFQASSAEIQDEILAANGKFMASFEKGDAAGIAALYTRDGQLLPPNSDVVTGRDSIEAFWKAVMGKGIKAVKLETVEIVGQADSAIEFGEYTLIGEDQVIDSGKYSVVWRPDEGVMRLHRDIWNSNMSMGIPDYAKAGKIAYAAAGYYAKILCSAVFVSKRDPVDIQNVDLAGFPFKAKVDYQMKSVRVPVGLGMPDQEAIFREGLGCTLAINRMKEHIQAQVTGDPTPLPLNLEKQNLLWPEGELVNTENLPPEVKREELKAAIDRTFTEPYADQKKIWGTRAVVVVYKGRIIAERYAPGFSKDTPLLGWSMTKSITNALVGILVGQGKLSIKDPATVPEWSGKDDPRTAITLDQLLRMSSGLDFVEVYTDILSDTPWMLFGTPDSAGFTAAKPLGVEPDSRWRYISGSSNLVCRIIRDAIGGPLARYFAFPRRALFEKIGMQSAVIEPDATGTFVGSSFSYAKARDWARFGLLYLNDGLWEGERILPKGWVEYSTTPTPRAPKGEYGAYWWLNAGNPLGSDNRFFKSLPSDLYLAWGYEGQNVIVIPSRDLVLVHLGKSVPPALTWDPEEFVAGVLAAIKQ